MNLYRVPPELSIFPLLNLIVVPFAQDSNISEINSLY